MNTQQQLHFYKESDRPRTAMISLLFSSLSGLILALILGFSLFGSTILYDLMCFLAHSFHENGTTVILCVLIYLPLLLAIIIAFRRSSNTFPAVVATSHALALGLFLLSVVALPYLFFLTSACYG